MQASRDQRKKLFIKEVEGENERGGLAGPADFAH